MLHRCPDCQLPVADVGATRCVECHAIEIALTTGLTFHQEHLATRAAKRYAKLGFIPSVNPRPCGGYTLRMQKPIAKSAGHICFMGDFEFFEADGQVVRAPIYACLMTDGRRSGRWECSIAHWERIGRACVEKAFA